MADDADTGAVPRRFAVVCPLSNALCQMDLPVFGLTGAAERLWARKQARRPLCIQ